MLKSKFLNGSTIPPHIGKRWDDEHAQKLAASQLIGETLEKGDFVRTQTPFVLSIAVSYCNNRMGCAAIVESIGPEDWKIKGDKTMQKSDIDAAVKARTTHQFLPGQGYFKVNALKNKVGGPTDKASPPQPVADKSEHVLQMPGGDTKTMRWVATEGAWESTKPEPARRMAFTAEYLSSHGWKYVKAV